MDEIKLHGINDVKSTILFMENLNKGIRDKPFEDISIDDFMYSEDLQLNSFRIPAMRDLIIFIDIAGRTKIIKNRWGASGEVK